MKDVTKELKTIKQLADELGIPKNKVNYQVSKLNRDFIVKINGIKYLKNEAEKEIKGRLNIKLNDELNTNLDSFKHHIKHLEMQLNSKDSQISKLHDLLDQQQQLQLKTQQMLEEKTLLLETVQKRKWWKFWKN